MNYFELNPIIKLLEIFNFEIFKPRNLQSQFYYFLNFLDCNIVDPCKSVTFGIILHPCHEEGGRGEFPTMNYPKYPVFFKEQNTGFGVKIPRMTNNWFLKKALYLKTKSMIQNVSSFIDHFFPFMTFKFD